MAAQCIKRLIAELKDIKGEKSYDIRVSPDESALTTWYFVMPGPKDTAFEGGEYMGRITFPETYPFSAPSIMFITPSAAFLPGAKICMSMTSFHNETWTPAWRGITIILGLSSFMAEFKTKCPAYPGIVPSATIVQCKEAASKSHEWNTRNEIYCQHFA